MPLVLLAALAADLIGHVESGLRPTDSAYGAVVYTFLALQFCYVFTLVVMGWFVLARSLAGLIDRERRQMYDNTMLIWHYAVAQALIAIAIVQFFPRLAG